MKIYKEIEILVSKLSNPKFTVSGVMMEAAPVPAFGNIYHSQIATLGLNPSNIEFVDNTGNEHTDSKRRFHTLTSLGLSNWDEFKQQHAEQIWQYCEHYFLGNPYNNWFKPLDSLFSAVGVSFYFPFNNICHLDLVPFATSEKWGNLQTEAKNFLLKESIDSLGRIIEQSPINTLILNGSAVAENLEKLTGVKLSKIPMKNWDLPRKSGNDVNGYAYSGELYSLGGMKLSKQVKILGFNHNLQSSYGVTSRVSSNIKEWITRNLNSKNETRR